MKVLIVGSCHSEVDPNIRKQFEEACFEIGKELAAGGHTLIVGSSTEYTADFHVVNGAKTTNDSVSIHVIRPKDDEIHYANTDLPMDRYKGTWVVARIHQLLECDVALLIAGGEKTLHAGFAAYAFRKPVIPIPSFGGSAYEVWDYLENQMKSDPKLSQLLTSFEKPWNRNSAKQCVKVVNYVGKKNPFKKTRPGFAPYGILMFAIVLAVGWASLFQFLFLPEFLRFMSLLAFSSLMGVTLRNSMNLLNGVSLEAHRFAAEVTSGLLIAIGLAVLYMAGVFTVTGQFDVLEFDSQADFHRAGLIMSILGLFAGSQIEVGAARLAKILKDVADK